MKRLLTLAVALLITLTSYCQKNYTAKSTEIYELKNSTWTLTAENRDVDIKVHVLKRFMHIAAKTDGYFYFDETQKEIREPKFSGYSYQAYEFTSERKCQVDVIEFKDGTNMISVTWLNEGFNVRYYF